MVMARTPNRLLFLLTIVALPSLQCIVLATRPLLMCLIREMLENITAKREHRQLATPIKALLKASQESATKSLRILLSLQSQHLLGAQSMPLIFLSSFHPEARCLYVLLV